MAVAEAVAIAELRRRMQGSFSPGELKDLGASIGLEPSDAWNAGPESAVRDIVRRAHDGPGLGRLLERLKVDRPLVEWPEPPSLRAGLAAPHPLGPTSRISSAAGAPPTETAIPDLDGPTIADPYAHPADLTPPPIPADVALAIAPAAPVATSPVTEAAAAAPSGAAGPPSGISPPTASWPMQNLPVPEKKGLDPRLLAISVACVALAVGLAFVGGIVFSRRSAPPVIAGTTRTETLAGHAANVMDGAIVEVARGCGLVVDGAPDRTVLRRAQTTCGHPVAVAGRPPSAGYNPADIEPPKLDVAPPSPRAKPITGPGGPAAPPTDLCRAACKTDRRTCMTGCGPEPRDAGDFEKFQQCNSKCLGAESSCRQRCQ